MKLFICSFIFCGSAAQAGILRCEHRGTPENPFYGNVEISYLSDHGESLVGAIRVQTWTQPPSPARLKLLGAVAVNFKDGGIHIAGKMDDFYTKKLHMVRLEGSGSTLRVLVDDLSGATPREYILNCKPSWDEKTWLSSVPELCAVPLTNPAP